MHALIPLQTAYTSGSMWVSASMIVNCAQIIHYIKVSSYRAGLSVRWIWIIQINPIPQELQGNMISMAPDGRVWDRVYAQKESVCVFSRFQAVYCLGHACVERNAGQRASNNKKNKSKKNKTSDKKTVFIPKKGSHVTH